ncbi:HepT-like ribonuclease domain-containing protein [Bacteroidota bacterium]
MLLLWIHDYIGVDYSIVWDVIQNKIPGLFEEIQKVLEEEK